MKDKKKMYSIIILILPPMEVIQYYQVFTGIQTLTQEKFIFPFSGSMVKKYKVIRSRSL